MHQIIQTWICRKLWKQWWWVRQLMYNNIFDFLKDWGRVAYSLTERGFSVESSLQGNSSQRFVGSNVNVILTRQTCGQRLKMSAGSKRQALKEKFKQICYIFLISGCRRDRGWYLGLCTSWVRRPAVQCQIPIFPVAKHTFLFGSATQARRASIAHALIYTRLRTPKETDKINQLLFCIYFRVLWRILLIHPSL